ncbi:MAG TPA: hypothetical protein VH253_07250 [Phycisphaerae bacterium]|nr:hypothetical protein [Phycisphaerae bacterium]
MSKRSQQKRQARARERAKDARRRRNASPIALLAPESSIRCYIQGGVEDEMARLSIFRDMAGGYLAFAGFLIDYRCLGVKDAHARFYLNHEEVKIICAGNSKPISTDAARNLVAAAIRWNRMNPFHLPLRTDRCLAILGGDLDLESADISHFGAENGGLHYLGYKSDLARALTIPLHEFLDRDDVTAAFVPQAGSDFNDDDDELDPDESDDQESPVGLDGLTDGQTAALKQRLNALIDAVLDSGCNRISEWAGRTGRTPHPEIRMAITVLMVNTLRTVRPDGGAAGDADDSDSLLVPPEVPQDELNAALEQITQFMRENPGVNLLSVPEDAPE